MKKIIPVECAYAVHTTCEESSTCVYADTNDHEVFAFHHEFENADEANVFAEAVQTTGYIDRLSWGFLINIDLEGVNNG